MPQVSIVIINYNTFELTCKCIRSIYDQTKSVSFEIILLDNGSTEADPITFKQQFKDLQLIHSASNMGFSKGNNLALKICKGEVILLLNSDTFLKEDSVSICYHELMSQNNLGAITCKLKYPNGKLQNNCQSFPDPLKLLIEKLRIHKFFTKDRVSDYLQGVYWNYERTGNPDWIWGTFFMFRRAALAKLPNHKLNEDYFMYLEDMQWCKDLRHIGYEIGYTPQTAIIHLTGGSSDEAHRQISENIRRYLKHNNSYLSRKMIELLSK